MDKISAQMTIAEVLKAYPQTADVLQSLGIHCLGCPSATRETIHEAALKHGESPEQLLKQLNQAAEKS